MGSDSSIPRRQRGDRDDNVLAQGWVVSRFGDWWSKPPSTYPVLRSFSVHPPKHRGDKFLVVLRGYTEDGEVVAFHKGSTLLGAIANALRRLTAGVAGWKPETPWKDRNR